MKFFRTTNKHKKYWQERKIDWVAHYMNPDHRHRHVISAVLKTFHWLSLIEIGCGAGANLVNIIKSMPGRKVQLGGVDINPDAIASANKTFTGGLFKVGSADDIMLSDKATDVILSDMTLIYVGPWEIRKYLNEIKRVARNHLVLCEMHSESWWNRMALWLNEGYFAYDYKRLLERNGFYDIAIHKLRPEDWPEPNGSPGHEPQKTFAHIVVARVPKK